MFKAELESLEESVVYAGRDVVQTMLGVGTDVSEIAILGFDYRAPEGLASDIRASAPENNEVFDYWLRVPNEVVLSPIVNLIPIRIVAYHLGVLRGVNPDKPRNLAKSVTVK